MTGPRSPQCVICKQTEQHHPGCPNGVALAADPVAQVLASSEAERRAALDAAGNAAALQRMLDLAHLKDRVQPSELGPVVTWEDIATVMPHPENSDGAQ